MPSLQSSSSGLVGTGAAPSWFSRTTPSLTFSLMTRMLWRLGWKVGGAFACCSPPIHLTSTCWS
ncbi:hypothetical protein JG688_00013908 [Phytophthora aleatoria]|uniref:Uncharacterized protein n=1 Tax=Phytophthora aleatoria TaxID=2496075 RepID=A0A8J5IGR4_9STRA|nr:hypothetical protein JG688_00013908 [Phytophthora aleatoria]